MRSLSAGPRSILRLWHAFCPGCRGNKFRDMKLIGTQSYLGSYCTVWCCMVSCRHHSSSQSETVGDRPVAMRLAIAKCNFRSNAHCRQCCQNRVETTVKQIRLACTVRPQMHPRPMICCEARPEKVCLAATHATRRATLYFFQPLRFPQIITRMVSVRMTRIRTLHKVPRCHALR